MERKYYRRGRNWTTNYLTQTIPPSTIPTELDIRPDEVKIKEAFRFHVTDKTAERLLDYKSFFDGLPGSAPPPPDRVPSVAEMGFSQARKIICRFGGVTKLLLALSRVGAPNNVMRIMKWMAPKEHGGTDGLIPTRYIKAIIVAARHEGIVIPSDDWNPVSDSAFTYYEKHGSFVEVRYQGFEGFRKRCKRTSQVDAEGQYLRTCRYCKLNFHYKEIAQHKKEKHGRNR